MAERQQFILAQEAAARFSTSGSVKSATAACPLEVCEVRVLIIGCNHKDRAFVLQLANGSKPNERERVIQVISSSNAPEVIKLNFSGSCGRGHPSTAAESQDVTRDLRPNKAKACPTVAVTGYKVDVDQPATLKVRVYPKLERVDESFIGFLQHYLFPTLTPSVYSVQSKKCVGDGQLSAQIEVFPPFKVSGEFGISFLKKSDPSRQTPPRGVTSRYLDQALWKIEGAIRCEVDQHQWKIGADRESTRDVNRKPDSGQGAFASLRDKAGAFFNFLDQVHEHYDKRNQQTSDRSYNVTVTYPSFALEVESALKELKDKYTVDLECSITATLKFIEAKIECDIVTVLLERGGPVANFIQFVREQLAKELKDQRVGARLDLGVLLTVQGKIAGTLKYKKKAESAELTPTGAIEGNLGLSARGFIDIEGRAFLVTAAAGMSVEIQGAETNSEPASLGAAAVAYQTKEGKMGVRGQIKGNGMAIYYVAYYRVGVEKNENSKEAESKRLTLSKKKKKAGSVKTEDKREQKSKYVLFDPWAWPEADGELAQALS